MPGVLRVWCLLSGKVRRPNFPGTALNSTSPFKRLPTVYVPPSPTGRRVVGTRASHAVRPQATAGKRRPASGRGGVGPPPPRRLRPAGVLRVVGVVGGANFLHLKFWRAFRGGARIRRNPRVDARALPKRRRGCRFKIARAPTRSGAAAAGRRAPLVGTRASQRNARRPGLYARLRGRVRTPSRAPAGSCPTGSTDRCPTRSRP